MARMFVDGFELPNVDDYGIKLIDSKTDLNNLRTRLARSNGSPPQNCPSHFDSSWAIFVTLEVNDSTRIQLALDSQGSIFGRGKGGENRTPDNWTQWKQIC